jgi:hypothetical protein
MSQKTCLRSECSNTFDLNDIFYRTPIGRYGSTPVDFYCPACARQDFEKEERKMEVQRAQARRKLDNDPEWKLMQAGVV